MQHENGPGSSPEGESNQEFTQEDLELRNSIFDDEDSMAAFRKVRPTMSLEDFNRLNHDQLNELAGDIAKRLEAEKNHKEFLELVNNYDFVLVTAAAQELGIEVRTVKQLNDLDDFSIARIGGALIGKHGRDGNGAAQPVQSAQPTAPVANQSNPGQAQQGSGEQSGNSEQDNFTDLRDALKDIYSNENAGNPQTEAEKVFRENTISNLRTNDAWLRDVAGVEPDSLNQMSTVDLGKLFNRFLRENGANYRSAANGEQQTPPAANTEQQTAQTANSEQQTTSANDTERQNGETNQDDAERREKKRKAGRWGKRVAAGVVALGLLGGGIFGFFGRSQNKAEATKTDTSTSTDVDNSGITTSEQAYNDLTTESAEDAEGPWDASTGNDARGLFADENDPTRANPDKLGEHNLVDDEEFQNEDLSTEQGKKDFKEHFIKVNERQAANMAMFADYMSLHGGEKYIPESIRGLSGEALEDAIIDNKDGCYADLCKSYEDFINNANVRKGSLKAGKYTNYFAKQINPDQLLTKDNIELYSTTTFENEGTPCFVFESDDGIVYTVKQVCAQAITEITGNPVTPPTETPPNDNPPKDNPPNDNPPKDNPPKDNPPNDNPPNNNPPNDSKSEQGLADGQGGHVRPVEAGEREVEDLSQTDYDPAHPVIEEQTPESIQANQDQAGDINDTAEGAAQRLAREQAAAEQAQINQERNDDVATQPDFDALNADHF